MLKDNQLIEIPWTQTAQKYFGDLGYSLYKGEVIFVKPEELPKGSHRIVTAVCDCCGKEIQIQYKQYLKRIEKHDNKYYCKECFGSSKALQESKQAKTKETCLKKYGVDNPMKTEEGKSAMEQGIFNKYGTGNLMSLEEFQNKIKSTCLNKYGVETALKLPKSIENAKNAMLNKYGVEKAFCSEEIRSKAKKSCLEKYGVEYTLQNEDFRKQCQKTLAQSGNVPVSKPQKAVFEMLSKHFENCFLNYPIECFSLDCAIILDIVKIDIEYDGWYWHQDQQKDIKRDKMVQKFGYKVLRIKGGESIPDESELLVKINELINSDKKYREMILKDYKF